MDRYYTDLRCELTKSQMTRRTDSDGREAWLRDGRTVLSQDGFDEGSRYFDEQVALRPNLVFFGAGHIAKALYDIAVMLDLNITIFDDREELCSAERFPDAERHVAPFEELLSKDWNITNPYYVIFTHGHRYDRDCLSWCLKHSGSYIGMIGSRRKIAGTFEALEKLGHTHEELLTVHTPIGLDIHAATPQEIAISIAAELISCYRSDKSQIMMEGDMISYLEKRDKKTVVARIIEKSGSGPREVGTEMAITDTSFFMTIGGGAIEEAVIKTAREILKSGEISRTVHYDLTPDGDLGMACGGNATVLFRVI